MLTIALYKQITHQIRTEVWICAHITLVGQMPCFHPLHSDYLGLQNVNTYVCLPAFLTSICSVVHDSPLSIYEQCSKLFTLSTTVLPVDLSSVTGVSLSKASSFPSLPSTPSHEPQATQMAPFCGSCSVDGECEAMFVEGGNPGFKVHAQGNVKGSEEEGPRG